MVTLLYSCCFIIFHFLLRHVEGGGFETLRGSLFTVIMMSMFGDFEISVFDQAVSNTRDTQRRLDEQAEAQEELAAALADLRQELGGARRKGPRRKKKFRGEERCAQPHRGPPAGAGRAAPARPPPVPGAPASAEGCSKALVFESMML